MEHARRILRPGTPATSANMFSRRKFLRVAAAVAAAPMNKIIAAGGTTDVHRQILDEAAGQEKRRRARFAAVAAPADLEALQRELRQKFLNLLGGLPEAK